LSKNIFAKLSLLFDGLVLLTIEACQQIAVQSPKKRQKLRTKPQSLG